MLPRSDSDPPVSYRDVLPERDLLVTLHEPDARVHRIPEAVIQDVWRALRFDVAALTTTDGRPIVVRHPGALNTNAGPDFHAARVEIDGLAWTGDVEVHRTSGEWIEHRHDADPAYDRVVLHVTLVADRFTGTLLRSDGTTLPEVVLYPRLRQSLRTLLHRFYAAPSPDLYCASHWSDIPVSVRTNAIRLLGHERLADRSAALAEAYLARPDLEQLLYERVLRALGYATNADPMEALAERVPLARLRTLADPRDGEALLLGAAALVPSVRDLLGADRDTADYAADLRDRFERLSALDPVTPLSPIVWRRSKLRASSLPTRRIVQAAALAAPGGWLRADPVSALMDALGARRPLSALRTLLTASAPSDFWRTHVRLDRSCKPMSARIGRARADAILVNAVLPALLLHAEQDSVPGLDALVLAVFRSVPPSSDAVTRRFEALGTKPANALDVQGMHQLYRTRCCIGRCLSCTIGRRALAMA